MLHFMGSQRVRHNRATELNRWLELRKSIEEVSGLAHSIISPKKQSSVQASILPPSAIVE